ncbi:MAG: hypothetical protein ACTSWC_03425 [Promethearchaeota archaeon]
MGILKQIDTDRCTYIKKGYFLSYYFKAHGEQEDFVSQRLLNFKDGIEPWTSKWIAALLFNDLLIAIHNMV